MKRSLFGIVGAAVAVIAVAQPAHAQVAPACVVTIIGTTPPESCFETTTGYDQFTTMGEFVAGPATPLDSPFNVYCVQQLGIAGAPDFVYAAYVTPLPVLGTTPNTPFPPTEASNWREYAEAALLVNEWQAAGSNLPNDDTPADNPLDAGTYQWAMWSVMGSPGACTGNAIADASNSACTATVESLINSANAETDTQLAANDAAYGWSVITDAGNDCPNSDTAHEKCQEFIYESAPPPAQVTPEPATMSLLALGLAGMAGAGFRRRKRQ